MIAAEDARRGRRGSEGGDRHAGNPDARQRLLDESVAFAIDVLKLAAAHAPESFRDLMSLILEELADQKS